MIGLLLLFIIILLFAIVCYLLFERDILSPPVLMSNMFLLSITFALLNVKNWEIDYSLEAALILISGIMVFTFPILFIHKKIRPTKTLTIDRPLRVDAWKIISAIIICYIIIFLYKREINYLASVAGYSGDNLQWFIRNVTSYEGILNFSSKMRIMIRFVDVTAYIFAFTLINNRVIHRYKYKFDYLMLIPIFLFIYKTLLLGGRQDILKLLFACVVQTYILEKRKLGWGKSISGKYFTVGFAGIAIGIPAFYYTLFLAGRSTSRTLFQSISTYIGGPIQHFNQFIQDPPDKSPFFGNETLTPVLNFLNQLGIIDYQNTVHLEFRRLGVTIGNVYTFFRRPIQDFGLVGMYIFVICVGIFFGYYYYANIRRADTNFRSDVSTIVYSYIFYWIFLSSIEQYSMTIISIYTLIGIVLFYILGYFYWKIEFRNGKIIIINQDNNVITETGR
ncbi:O-antigen polymerase [Streptococcus pacificus]|uniref:Oligosaccharide repeat unit polymerase n=1 Tax=Streptococcus pacificus TaxID=2740577 RepID=A0ABS0ZHD0_9STRE|nr:O-antigen polymerase [Streptococcus pacificus]MBJ8325403.1 oligosaccharide repeat unit polymerase [Streptococcus pacificus]